MKSIAAIFRKDARHLWPQIAIFWLLTLLSVAFDPGRADRASWPYQLFLKFLSFAQPLACWTLIVAAIHEERLPGDRQYWLTRPFTWRTLLAEKTFFIAAFINAAVLLEQSAILWRSGISPFDHAPTLFWKQVFFTAVMILPVAAFAAVTRNLGEVILTSFAVFVPYLLLLQLRAFTQRQPGWNDMQWVRTAMMCLVIAAGVGAVLLMQYARRRTYLSRVLVGGTTCALILTTAFLPRAWALSVRSWWPNSVESTVRVSLLDPSRRMQDGFRSLEGTVMFDLPIRFEGLPAGTEVIPERFSAKILLPGKPPMDTISNRFILPAAGQGQLNLYVRRGIYDIARQGSATLTGTIEFAILRDRRSYPAPGAAGQAIPGVGVCFRSPSGGLIGPVRWGISCTTPFPKAAVFLFAEGGGRPNWIIPPGSVDAPIPTDAGFDILDNFSSQVSYKDESEMGGLRLYTARPVAHAPVAFSFQDVRLADYVR